ncbi:hypothetical protein [Moheibacter lacus]|uniref:T9SS C-terminal target domain-containing protein n=1 Tax=Moheibacter lacus TaxID=2745851 RepID=A0A838ZQL5_9FLAO|nr:hypothetical protein [Moheibacter lacus]MBA5628252.1 hypothetical protein [Moheibacter lacus]
MKNYTVAVIFILNFLNLSAQMKIDTLDIENYQIKTLEISEKLKEISSLEIIDGHYWGQNDSGGKPELYKINPETGKIIQTVKITNAENRDWEELAVSDQYFFIGDFGNNNGKRKDLAIFYFPISELESKKKEISVEVQKIEFSFPEQKDFDPGNKKTNFDCEAMFYYKGKLHLFTKEWSNLATSHYILDIKPGKQQAIKVETFKTNYLVTGATIDTNPISNTHGFYLIGYTPDGVAFISGFSLPKNGKELLFSNKLNKFNLPLGFTAQVGQTEGISIKPDKPSVICFSNEDFKFKTFHVEQSVQCIHSLAE